MESTKSMYIAQISELQRKHNEELDKYQRNTNELSNRITFLERENQILQKQTSSSKQQDSNSEYWETKYKDSCLKITEIVKENRKLNEELGRLKSVPALEQNHFAEEVRFDNDLLKKRNAALVKLVAKLTSVTWDYENEIDKLNRYIRHVKVNVPNVHKKTNADKSNTNSSKPAVSWTIPTE